MNSSEKITVETIGLAYGGSCIGKIQSGPEDLIGKKALVRFSAPKELVSVTPNKDEKSLMHADLLEVIKPSENRVSPPCKYFTVCGGCDLQQIDIHCQREEKLKLVTDTLRIHGGLTPTNTPILLGNDLPAFGYRRKISLHINENGDMGFFKQGTGEIVAIEKCLLAEDPINDAIEILIPEIRKLAATIAGLTITNQAEQICLLLKIRENALPSQKELQEKLSKIISLFPNTQVSYQGKIINLGTLSKNDFPTAHFIQVNQHANDILVSTVLSLIKNDSVTDLYAGSGNFSLPLAKNGKKVFAVEISEDLVKYGRKLASEQKLESLIKFSNESCEKFIRRNTFEGTVLLDPPRSGAKAVVEQLKNSNAKQIVYVSCNVPSLMRDLKVLKSAGFRFVNLFVLDMFSQTHHVEAIAEMLKED